MKILGLARGQNRSAWESWDTATGEVTRGGLRRDDDLLRKLLDRTRPDQRVIASGPLAARGHDLARAAGVAVLVADTTPDAWPWQNVKRKTDADDAGQLVRLAALGPVNPVHIPASAVRARRHRRAYRPARVAEPTRCQNRMRATRTLRGRKRPSGQTGWSAAARPELAAPTRSLAEGAPEELWRGLLRTARAHWQPVETRVAPVTAPLDALAQADPRVAPLRTIRGVGPRTAAVIVTVLDPPQRFPTRRPVGAYAGLVPRPVRAAGPQRSHHQAGPCPVAAGAQPGGLDGGARQPRVAGVLSAAGGRPQETPQASDCGRDAKVAGDRVGDAARRHRVSAPAAATPNGETGGMKNKPGAAPGPPASSPPESPAGAGRRSGAWARA